MHCFSLTSVIVLISFFIIRRDMAYIIRQYKKYMVNYWKLRRFCFKKLLKIQGCQVVKLGKITDI